MTTREPRGVMKLENPSLDQIAIPIQHIAFYPWDKKDADKFEKYVLNNVFPVVNDKKFLNFLSKVIKHVHSTAMFQFLIKAFTVDIMI